MDENLQGVAELKRAVLIRLKDSGRQTLGELHIYDGLLKIFSCKTLEPAWKNNQRNVSCIPIGRYHVKARWSKKYKDHFIVEEVRGRSYILFHVGNFREDTEGCVLVGRDYARIDSDELLDITSSRATMNTLLNLMPKEWLLDIVDVSCG